jgi:hypothetical protein
VLLETTGKDSRVVGYYAINPTEVVREELPRPLPRGGPRTVPAWKLVVAKYHTMLHSVFERALVDRVVTFNPCAHTELSKRVKKNNRTLTPVEYDAILTTLPARHRLLVQTATDTGLRWASSSPSNPATSTSTPDASPSRRSSSRCR